MKKKTIKQNSIIRLISIIILLSLISPAAIFSQGTTINDSMFSTSLNKYAKYSIYLPPGYVQNGSAFYRVVYFLHGANLNYLSYAYISGILDSLITNGIIQPVICVKPNGACAPYLGSFYTNSALYGQYENFIYNDLVQYIDANYNTRTYRNGRCIMGHSMGGYGSIKMAFKHPELYRAVASHSGPLDFTMIPLIVPGVIAEAGGGPPYTFLPYNGPVTALGFTMCGAFSPNLANPPFYVDFMLNSSGSIVPGVFAKFKDHCGARLSMNVNAGSNLAIYLDCGLQDELGMLYFNMSFRDTLVTRNIPHRYLTFTGTHSGKIRERLPVSLKFLDSVMNSSAGFNSVNVAAEIEVLKEDVLDLLNANIISQDNYDMLVSKLDNAIQQIEQQHYKNSVNSIEQFIFGANLLKKKNILSMEQLLALLKQAYRVTDMLNTLMGTENCTPENVSVQEKTCVLNQNYPNPFNPVTMIKFSIAKESEVSLNVYDLSGRLIKNIVNTRLNAGSYEYMFNGSNLSSGIYFYKLETGSFTDVKKMILVK